MGPESLAVRPLPPQEGRPAAVLLAGRRRARAELRPAGVRPPGGAGGAGPGRRPRGPPGLLPPDRRGSPAPPAQPLRLPPQRRPRARSGTARSTSGAGTSTCWPCTASTASPSPSGTRRPTWPRPTPSSSPSPSTPRCAPPASTPAPGRSTWPSCRGSPAWPWSAGWTSAWGSGRSTPTATAPPPSAAWTRTTWPPTAPPGCAGCWRPARRSRPCSCGSTPNRESTWTRGPDFWRALFDGVAACGRRVTLDLRAKAIADDTVAAALATGLPVLVNTKFWTEHQGLPYHATLLQEGDRYVRRHSYGDQLRYGDSPENTSGSPPGKRGPAPPLRLPLPAVEPGHQPPPAVGRPAVGAPLRRRQHPRRGHRVRGLRPPLPQGVRQPRRGLVDLRRPLPAPTTAGSRSATGPGTSSSDASATTATPARTSGAGSGPPGFGREAAPHLERALHAASGVLPLLTARHSPSASVFGYWPEKDMGGLLDLYLQVPASDVAMFASAQEAVAARLDGTPGRPPDAGAVGRRLLPPRHRGRGGPGAGPGQRHPGRRERRPRAARGGP